jgi:hypothetical protein
MATHLLFSHLSIPQTNDFPMSIQPQGNPPDHKAYGDLDDFSSPCFRPPKLA